VKEASEMEGDVSVTVRGSHSTIAGGRGRRWGIGDAASKREVGQLQSARRVEGVKE
jgi:hypothetical protein